MLIHLGERLAATIEAELTSSDAVVQALQNLAQARAQGDHILTAGAGVISAFIDNPRLSPSTKGIFKKIEAEQSQVGALKDRIATFVEVASVWDDISIEISSSKRIIHVPLVRFQRNDIAQPTFLVGENLLDCHIFLRYASWFSKKYLEGRLPTTLRAVFVPGGGDTTDRVLGHLSNERRYFSLCITDSDRQTPQAALGQTARKCQALSLSELCTHFTLQTRSIENLFASNQIRKVLEAEHERNDLLPKLARLEHLANTEAWKYLPLKDGLRELNGPPSSQSDYWYWNAVPASVVAAQDGFLLPSISSKLLTWMVDYLQTNDPEDIKSDAQLHTIWTAITEIVTAWTCGTQPIRV